MDFRVKNEKDNVYTRLLVLEFDKCINNRAYWKCLCDPEFGGCGKIISVRSGNLRSGHTKSCGCYKKGRVVSEKTKRKMSKAAFNRDPISDEIRKKIAESQRGKHHTEEAKKKIGEARRGEKHPRWNSNLTDEDRVGRRHIPGYKEWRKTVYELDEYTCQKCGKGRSLNAHHVESYRSTPELRTEVSNGITLCETCHKDFHHQYGYGDNIRAQLIEFLRRT